MSKFRRVITQWFGRKPYTTAMYITSAATIVMAIMSGIMCYTVVQNNKALLLAAESLDIQRFEFQFRNRPYLVLSRPHFAGQYTDTSGRTHPHTIQLAMHNIADVPANQIHTLGKVLVNSATISTTVISSTGCTKADPRDINLNLSEEQYALCTNSTVECSIECAATYSGVLGEPRDKYKTSFSAVYYPREKKFLPRRLNVE